MRNPKKPLIVDPTADTVRSFHGHYDFEGVPGTDRLYARLA